MKKYNWNTGNRTVPSVVSIQLPVYQYIYKKIIETFELNGDKLYTEDQLNIVVKLYQSVLKEIIDSVSDDELMCVVLEKEMYRIKVGEINYLKGGFHLHFPSIFLNFFEI